MDHHEQHHQHHVKERDERKKEQKRHEQQTEKIRRLHPAWYVVVPAVLMIVGILVWILTFWR